MKKTKKRFGDRKDGTLIRDLDPMHYMMPYLFPDRIANEAYISETLDLTKTVKYLNEKNSDGREFKYTFFHLVVTTVLRLLTQRPKINRFISNNRIYQHNDATCAFVIKKRFSDDSEEGMAIVKADEDTNLEQVYETIKSKVYENRHGKGDKTSDFMDVFMKKLPRFAYSWLMSTVKFLDKRGKVPQSLIESDVYHSSCLISNLGSIKLQSGYHHLANWGTTSLFVTIGKIEKTPFFSDDGTVEMRDGVKIGLTIDERVADGYYYSSTVRMMKKLLENPELLEQNISEEVEID